MNRPVRVLIVEDSEDDTQLLLRALRRGGYEPAHERVDTAEGMQSALDQKTWEIILSDYTLPQFSAPAALAVLKARDLDVPFLIVSGSVGEATAVEMMRAGAHDYIMKENLTRFLPAIERELREAAARRARREAEQLESAERRRLEAELRQQVAALQEADRQKDQFLGMLAHELRNPLAAISNAVYLLRKCSPGTPPWERAMETVERQLRHQIHLVDDLLDVSRITRGKIELRREPLDLSGLICGTAEDYGSLFGEAGVMLRLELPREPLWVSADAARLSQILGNLLSNAAKFTGAGGQVTVSLAVAEVPHPRALLTVRDTGAGIDPSLLPHMFHAFVQGDRSLDRSRGGLGLGLALVKGLVELHGGEVGVHSDGLGHGAVFTVSLPIAAAPTETRTVDASPEKPAAGLHALLVEDNRDVAEMLRLLLEKAGHKVDVAFSGTAGLEAARRLRPDIVLCDVGLPGMDGYAVARSLREDPNTASLWLVALTGYGDPDHQRRSLDAGFDLHLTKPVELAALERLMAARFPA